MANQNLDPDREPKLGDPVVRGDERSGMTMMGIVAAIAVALLVGLFFMTTGDQTNTSASKTSPGVTTGSSPPSPPPSGDKAAPQTGK